MPTSDDPMAEWRNRNGSEIKLPDHPHVPATGATRPLPRSKHQCEQPAKCWGDPDCPVYSSRGAGGQPTTTTAPYAGDGV